MTDRLLEDGTTTRTLESGATRILEEAVVVTPPDTTPTPGAGGLVQRLLEDGSPRILEDGTARILESLPADTIVSGRPFRFGIGPSSGPAPTVELSDFAGIAVKATRADGWSADWGMSGLAAASAVLDELATDLFVYRLAQPWKRMRVLSVGQGWDENGGSDVSCIAVDHRGVLNRRYVQEELTFTSATQGLIAWGLVDHTQQQVGGDLGLTWGTLDDSVDRDRTYLVGDNIGQRLRELSEVIDGPWYEIDPDLTFHVYAPGTERRYSLALALGVTARRIARASGAATYANSVQGTGDNEQTTRVVADAPDLATNPRGRWEAVASWPSVTRQTTLEEHTAAELAARTRPLTRWTATLDPQRWLSDFPVVPYDIVNLVVPTNVIAPVGTPKNQVLVQVDSISFSVVASGEITPPEIEVIELEASE